MLAYRLKCSIAEVEKMRTVEFFEWLAFFEIYDNYNQQLNKQYLNNKSNLAKR